MTNEDLLKALIEYLSINKMKVTDQDERVFRDIIAIASNNGYRAAIGLEELKIQ